MGERKRFLPIAGFEPGTYALAGEDLNNYTTVPLRLCTIQIGYNIIFLHTQSYISTYTVISSQWKQL